MTTYKIILSDFGKKAFFGGNVESMSKVLISFEAKNHRAAYKKMDYLIATNVGSGSAGLFDLVQVSNPTVA